MDVCLLWELSGRGLELITRPEESYRLWCVVVCDLETWWMRRPWPTGGCCVKNKHYESWNSVQALGLLLVSYQAVTKIYEEVGIHTH